MRNYELQNGGGEPCLIMSGCPATQTIYFKQKKALQDLIIGLPALKCKGGCQAAPEGQQKLGRVISRLTGELLTFCDECLSKSTLKCYK